MKKTITEYIHKLGFLRSMLVGMAVISILLKPGNGEPAILEGLGLVYTVIIPVIAPLILMLLLLDIIMSNVLKSDTKGEARKKYSLILRSDIFVCAMLLVFWVPYFMALGG